MSKVVISFWFRIPKDTVTAAKAQAAAYPPSFYPFIFYGIIPLVVFGDQVVAPVIQGDSRVVGTRYVLPIGGGPAVLENVTETYPVSSDRVPYAPSFIGIDCTDEAENYVIVNLQTKDFPTVNGFTFVNQFVQPTPGSLVLLETDYHLTDVSAASNVIPQSYGRVSRAVHVTPDEWHHIILSYDLTNPIATHGIPSDAAETDSTELDGTSSYNSMWYALDDVNYDESDLPAYWIFGGPPHAIISEQSIAICAAPWSEIDPAIGPNHRYFPDGADGPASYNCAASSIPAEVMTIPSLASYESGEGQQYPEHHIDMAELQIFMDWTLDTSIESKRRAFIDIKDRRKDNDGKVTMGPVKPERTEELLNRRPDILLHKTGNWKSGKNTGRLGLQRNTDGEDELIPEGQFTPTGTIVKFKPDPSLKKGGEEEEGTA